MGLSRTNNSFLDYKFEQPGIEPGIILTSTFNQPNWATEPEGLVMAFIWNSYSRRSQTCDGPFYVSYHNERQSQIN